LQRILIGIGQREMNGGKECKTPEKKVLSPAEVGPALCRKDQVYSGKKRQQGISDATTLPLAEAC
jgi:hypothetical protein